jgi:hypothetical protein
MSVCVSENINVTLTIQGHYRMNISFSICLHDVNYTLITAISVRVVNT